MFKKLLTALILFITAVILISAAETNQLSEVSKLKAENFKLKATLNQCNIKVTEIQLVSEKNQLTQDFKKELGASDEEVFNWNSLTFNSSKSNISR